MTESSNNTGLRIVAVFDDPKSAFKAKYEVIEIIKKNGGHGQARTVPRSSLTGPDCPYRIEQKKSR